MFTSTSAWSSRQGFLENRLKPGIGFEGSFRLAERLQETVGIKRMFEKSWQIKTHGTRTRVRPSCLEAGMGKHSR